MIIKGNDHFQSVCKRKLVDWYNAKACDECAVRKGFVSDKIDLSNVFVVWCCKTLQNYKALLSTTVSGDGIYVEFTYNGDKQELYMYVYKKIENICIRKE